VSSVGRQNGYGEGRIAKMAITNTRMATSSWPQMFANEVVSSPERFTVPV
jgi:hypothetical protein